MFYFIRITLIALVMTSIIGCEQAPPPVDGNGKTPDAVLMDTYQKILAGNLADAKQVFDPRLLNAVFTETNPANFESFYTDQTKNWQPGQLKTKIMGNDYNSEVWRVRIWNEDGTGAPGAVQDLAQINGQWRIVFWGDYPES